MDIRQKAREAVENTIIQFCNLGDVERELREAIADAVAVAALREAGEAMRLHLNLMPCYDGHDAAKRLGFAAAIDLLASLTPEPPKADKP